MLKRNLAASQETCIDTGMNCVGRWEPGTASHLSQWSLGWAGWVLCLTGEASRTSAGPSCPLLAYFLKSKSTWKPRERTGLEVRKRGFNSNFVYFWSHILLGNYLISLFFNFPHSWNWIILASSVCYAEQRRGHWGSCFFLQLFGWLNHGVSGILTLLQILRELILY